MKFLSEPLECTRKDRFVNDTVLNEGHAQGPPIFGLISYGGFGNPDKELPSWLAGFLLDEVLKDPMNTICKERRGESVSSVWNAVKTWRSVPRNGNSLSEISTRGCLKGDNSVFRGGWDRGRESNKVVSSEVDRMASPEFSSLHDLLCKILRGGYKRLIGSKPLKCVHVFWCEGSESFPNL